MKISSDLYLSQDKFKIYLKSYFKIDDWIIEENQKIISLNLLALKIFNNYYNI